MDISSEAGIGIQSPNWQALLTRFKSFNTIIIDNYAI